MTSSALTALPSPPKITHRSVGLSQVRLHVAEAGPLDGPPVLLLHGFPDFWWTWRHQMAALAAAGYRVLAPDLRGYNNSDQPQGVSAYGLAELVKDVEELVAWTGHKRVCLAGHDWGAMVAWEFAARRPQDVERLAILNVPHPRSMLGAVLSPRQVRKSWYIFAFALPWAADWLVANRDFAFVRDWLADYPPAMVQATVEAARRSGNLQGPVNYYRAALRDILLGRAFCRAVVQAPTLILWGEKDPLLGKELARPNPRWVPHAQVEMFPNAGHWVHVDAARRVSDLLADHFAPAVGISEPHARPQRRIPEPG